ncbi:hypothetical protein A4A49_07250 [Nicotiana attenuata]|uniref:Uncharacterized protein n=1 Tax=Nicotiana attenuata TaxID=49451 RepID=A0A1J6IL45_NICAT|nr:hypothetical protein A4A49_07250 [Nicotiana attenuata]
MARKLGSFRKRFEEKRERERLFSSCNGDYTKLPSFKHTLDYPENPRCFSSFCEKFREVWKDWSSVAVKAMEMGVLGGEFDHGFVPGSCEEWYKSYDGTDVSKAMYMMRGNSEI